jgi:hypothetical protein
MAPVFPINGLKTPRNTYQEKWEKRYNALSPEAQRQIDAINQMHWREYQLKPIKRTKEYPDEGDRFVLNPLENVYFVGIVIKNRIHSILGEDLLTVFIFRNVYRSLSEIPPVIQVDKLLIPPAVVGWEYWTRGYFSKIQSEIRRKKPTTYGFYRIISGKYVNESREQLVRKPKEIGIFGVATITGIASEIRKELIMDPTILSAESNI